VTPPSVATVTAAIDHAGELWREGALLACHDTLVTLQSDLARAPNLAPPDRREGVTIRLGAVRIRLGLLREAIPGLHELLTSTDQGYAALHLGAALRNLGEVDVAEAHLTRAFDQAKVVRDGVLAIAALCERSDLYLARGDTHRALEGFGQALGLSEFTSDPRPSVVPLSGLARIHARAGRRSKALEQAQRAYDRAGDRIGRARALAATAEALDGEAGFERAAYAARVAPHLPLWVAVAARAPAALSPAHRSAAAAAASAAGMLVEAGAIAAA
jgi:tetratricopeptide (TPR) repeat protein